MRNASIINQVYKALEGWQRGGEECTRAHARETKACRVVLGGVCVRACVRLCIFVCVCACVCVWGGLRHCIQATKGKAKASFLPTVRGNQVSSQENTQAVFGERVPEGDD